MDVARIIRDACGRAPAPRRPARRLILHIGAPKTGSTAIQSFCASHRAELLGEGALYPVSLGRNAHQPFAVAMGRLFGSDGLRRSQGVRGPAGVLRLRSDLAAALTREMDECAPDVAIISSENLFTNVRSARDARRIRKFLRPFAGRIEIVAYLRRQDRAMFSAWAHARRLGKTAEFVAPTRMERGGRYDYAGRLALWSRAFGRDAVSAISLDAVGGDVTADFLHRIGAARLRSDGETPNRSLDEVRASFMAAMSAYLPRLTSEGVNAVRGDLTYAIDAVPGFGPKLGIREVDARAIMRAYRDSNARLSREFGDGRPFFDDQPPEKSEEPHSMTIDDVIAISAALWARKHDAFRRLKDTG